jgi:hypothetical protein
MSGPRRWPRISPSVPHGYATFPGPAQRRVYQHTGATPWNLSRNMNIAKLNYQLVSISFLAQLYADLVSMRSPNDPHGEAYYITRYQSMETPDQMCSEVYFGRSHYNKLLVIMRPHLPSL